MIWMLCRNICIMRFPSSLEIKIKAGNKVIGMKVQGNPRSETVSRKEKPMFWLPILHTAKTWATPAI